MPLTSQYQLHEGLLDVISFSLNSKNDELSSLKSLRSAMRVVIFTESAMRTLFWSGMT